MIMRDNIVSEKSECSFCDDEPPAWINAIGKAGWALQPLGPKASMLSRFSGKILFCCRNVRRKVSWPGVKKGVKNAITVSSIFAITTDVSAPTKLGVSFRELFVYMWNIWTVLWPSLPIKVSPTTMLTSASCHSHQAMQNEHVFRR